MPFNPFLCLLGGEGSSSGKPFLRIFRLIKLLLYIKLLLPGEEKRCIVKSLG